MALRSYSSSKSEEWASRWQSKIKSQVAWKIFSKFFPLMLSLSLQPGHAARRSYLLCLCKAIAEVKCYAHIYYTSSEYSHDFVHLSSSLADTELQLRRDSIFCQSLVAAICTFSEQLLAALNYRYNNNGEYEESSRDASRKWLEQIAATGVLLNYQSLLSPTVVSWRVVTPLGMFTFVCVLLCHSQPSQSPLFKQHVEAFIAATVAVTLEHCQKQTAFIFRVMLLHLVAQLLLKHVWPALFWWNHTFQQVGKSSEYSELQTRKSRLLFTWWLLL